MLDITQSIPLSSQKIKFRAIQFEQKEQLLSDRPKRQGTLRPPAKRIHA